MLFHLAKLKNQRAYLFSTIKIISSVFFFISLYGLFFLILAEWTFWDEFGVRFNFIAVDYLIYTHEVVQNIVESYPLGKLLTGIAGFFGGLSISFFWQPKKLHQHGKLAAGAIIGGISVAAAFALGGVVANQLGVNINEADTALGIGYCIGVLSVGVISLIANFFDKREGQDILQVAQELKGKKPVVRRKRK